MKIEKYTDNRGSIMFASPELIGFIYKYQTVGTINPGHKRGGHWHKILHKKMLCVLGDIKYTLRHNDSMHGAEGKLEQGEVLDIPPGYVVNFYNDGNDVVVFIEFKNVEHDENDRFQDSYN